MIAFAIEFELDASDLSFEVLDAFLELRDRKRLERLADHGAARSLGGQEIVEIHGLSSRQRFAPILQTDRQAVELRERRGAALRARLLHALLAANGKREIEMNLPATMKAIVIDGKGGPEVLSL